MSTADKTKHVLTVVTHALTALETIGHLASGILAKDKPEVERYVSVLSAIEAAVQSIMAGLEGNATPAQIENTLAYLRARFASNDHAADAAIDAKFPPPAFPKV